MRVIGLDLSLNSTGVADGTHMDVIRTGSLRSHERLAYIWNELRRWTTGADLVVIEGPSYGSFTGGGEEMPWLRGHVQHRLWNSGTPFVVASPDTLKLFATGNGHASKDAMLAAAEAYVGPISGPVKNSRYDMADAYWLAALGRYALAGFPESNLVSGSGTARNPFVINPSALGTSLHVRHGREREAAAGADWSRAADLLDSLGITPPPPKPKPKKRRPKTAA